MTGSGAPGTPYVISSGGNSTTILDTPTINMTITGAGSGGSPYVISGSVKLDPAAGNLLEATATGLFLDCAAIAACAGAGVTSIEVQDTNSIDLALTGDGSVGDPFVISALLILDPAGLGSIGGDGLLITCEEVRACFEGGLGIAIDPDTGVISVIISADAGNTLTTGGDGGLYVAETFPPDRYFAGTGTPEGVVTADIGSLYLNDAGGALTTLYVKESGVGNTGWVAK